VKKKKKGCSGQDLQKKKVLSLEKKSDGKIISMTVIAFNALTLLVGVVAVLPWLSVWS